ncbi:MAG: hypothetical protein KGJ63_11695 [Pseudomonadota bacterium]|nr:hypothetical protein [Pseudomonadota bacterium]
MNIDAILRDIRFQETSNTGLVRTGRSAPCARMLLRRAKSIAHRVRSYPARRGIRVQGALLRELR